MDAKYETLPTEALWKRAVTLLVAEPAGRDRLGAFFSRLGFGAPKRSFYDPSERRRYVTQAAVERGRLSCLFPRF